MKCYCLIEVTVDFLSSDIEGTIEKYNLVFPMFVNMVCYNTTQKKM